VTAVVKSRLAVSAGPYSAGKLLLLRTRVPVADLRPRPPPPPPSFLSPATVGSRLQLRFEGAWWEVELRGVLPAAGTAEAPGGEGEGVEGEGGAAGESAATGEGGAAAGEGGAQERSPAARESRYCVASERAAPGGGWRGARPHAAAGVGLGGWPVARRGEPGGRRWRRLPRGGRRWGEEGGGGEQGEGGLARGLERAARTARRRAARGVRPARAGVGRLVRWRSAASDARHGGRVRAWDGPLRQPRPCAAGPCLPSPSRSFFPSGWLRPRGQARPTGERTASKT